jgi:hypothetical protein
MADLDASGALSTLLQRVGPPTAILWVAALAALIIGGLKAPPSFANGWLMLGGVFFFVACGFYCWRERALGASNDNPDDPPRSVRSRLADLQWGYIGAAAISFLLACVCGYLLWSGGKLPNRLTP